jgi:hypothetical protein
MKFSHTIGKELFVVGKIKWFNRMSRSAWHSLKLTLSTGRVLTCIKIFTKSQRKRNNHSLPLDIRNTSHYKKAEQ